MSAIFESRSLGPTERLIMLALADHADDEGRCYPAMDRLCQRTGLSERAVQTNVRKLVALGYVTIVPGGGRGHANLYFISANPASDAPNSPVNPALRAPIGAKNPARETPFLTTNPASPALNPASPALNPAGDAPEPSLTVIEPSNVGGGSAGASASVCDPSGSPTDPAPGLDRPPAPGLVGRLTHALGFDHHGIVPKYWVTPDAHLIVGRWQTDLRLTPEEILAVAVGNMRAHGSPAHGPKILTRHMADYAAARDAPLTPTPSARASPPGSQPDLDRIFAKLEAESRQQ